MIRYSPVSGLMTSTFARELTELMIISLILLRRDAGDVGERSIVPRSWIRNRGMLSHLPSMGWPAVARRRRGLGGLRPGLLSPAMSPTALSTGGLRSGFQNRRHTRTRRGTRRASHQAQ